MCRADFFMRNLVHFGTQNRIFKQKITLKTENVTTAYDFSKHFPNTFLVNFLKKCRQPFGCALEFFQFHAKNGENRG